MRVPVRALRLAASLALGVALIGYGAGLGPRWAKATHLPMGGWGTATVDGVIGPEWNNAGRVDLAIDVGGLLVPATFYAMNDATYLYVALRVTNTQRDPSWFQTFSMKFDNDADGVGEEGDDAFILYPSNDLHDIYATSLPPCNESTALCWLFDTDTSGSYDGTAAIRRDTSYAVYEIAKPLRSGDAGHDFTLAEGSVIGWVMQFTFNSGGGAIVTSFPASEHEYASWGRIAIVGPVPTTPLPTGSHSFTPTPSPQPSVTPNPSFTQNPFTPSPTPRPTFAPLTVEVVVPGTGHPVTPGTPLNVLLRLSSQYAYDREGFSASASLRRTTLGVERIREFETGPETLGVKLSIPTTNDSTNLYPGFAMLNVCVMTGSSQFGVAFGCGELQVEIK